MIFGLGARISPCSLILFSPLLFSLQFLSKFISLSNYLLIPRESHSILMSFYLIMLFISIFNFSTSTLLSYPLLLATLLNIWTNSSIVWIFCSSYLSSTTFTNLFSPSPNSFFNTVNSSPVDKNSQSSDSKYTRTFFFYISTISLCIYIKI